MSQEQKEIMYVLIIGFLMPFIGVPLYLSKEFAWMRMLSDIYFILIMVCGSLSIMYISFPLLNGIRLFYKHYKGRGD